jgi:2-hydroxychromene-2-carboxylate isomerase
VEIDLLYVPDCSNRILARDVLERALARTGRTAVIRERAIGSVEEAERLGMRGSPTFLIDGRDAFPGGDGLAAWSCRLYATDSGLRGIPTLEQLIEALMA